MITKGEGEERGINQEFVNNKEISPEYSLEGLMLKLKLQYFGHLMRRTDSSEKILMLGKFEVRRRGRQRMRWLDDIINSVDMGLVDCGSWWWTGRPGVLWFMGSQRVGHERPNWTEKYMPTIAQRKGKDHISPEETPISLKVKVLTKFYKSVYQLSPFPLWLPLLLFLPTAHCAPITLTN